jgi:hypothetical protein
MFCVAERKVTQSHAESTLRTQCGMEEMCNISELRIRHGELMEPSLLSVAPQKHYNLSVLCGIIAHFAFPKSLVCVVVN